MFNVWTIIIQSLNIKEWKLLELQITETGHPLSISDGKNKFNSPKNKKMFIKSAQKKRHIINVWTIIMQSLNIKYENLELQITQTRSHLSISNQKMSKFKTPPKMKKYSWNVHKIVGTHLQCVNNHYAKFEYKRWILLELQIKQTRHSLSISEGKNV